MADLSTLGNGDRVLLIHAHPDDETLATGATAAHLAARGVAVTLATASGGEAAELTDHNHDAARLQAARQRREVKLQRAAAQLGIREHHWLGGAGRWIDDAGRGGPGSLTNADPTELTAAIGALIDQQEPAVILTVGRDGITRHPDHALLMRSVTDAASQAGISTWGACVLDTDVAAAHRSIAEFTRQTVGSGGVQGVSASDIDLTVHTGHNAARAKRDALDEYAPNLTTTSLMDLFTGEARRGDTTLLRVVFDVAAWGTEHYQRLN